MALYSSLANRLVIRTKEGGLAPLDPNWAQAKFLRLVEDQEEAGKPVRVIVLKARQLGMSTVTNAVLFLRAFIHEQTHGLVIAHEADASEYLFTMTHLYWEQFPYSKLFTPKYVSRRELAWKETGSSIRIATAGNARAGRGRTVHSLHASEVAFWDRPEETMLGMRQTIPNRAGTMIVLESTANGVGNWFYDTWQAAEAEEVEFAPLFLPWWEHPEYTASYNPSAERPINALLSEERALRAMGVDDDHLKWRRWAIRNLADGNEEMFHQEYPSTPEEAFLASGTNVFPIQKLAEVYEPMDGVRGFLYRDGEKVKFIPDASGPLRIYRMPSKDWDWGKYFVAGDPTHTNYGDNACAQVINRRTWEQVATYVGKIDPMSFAEELAKLGRYYNEATISVEINGPGYATIGRLVEIGYPLIWQNRMANRYDGRPQETVGWSSSMKTKEWAVGLLIKLIHDKDITIHDRRTYDEMRNFVTLASGG
jgi:hypothetical protein